MTSELAAAEVEEAQYSEENYDDDEFEKATIGSKPSEISAGAGSGAGSGSGPTASHELTGHVPTQLIPIQEDE